MTRTFLLISAVVVVLGASFWFGFEWGTSKKDLEYREAIQNLNQRLGETTALLKKKEADRLAEIRQLNNLVNQLEDEAREDIDADRPALGADSVMRLNRVD